MDRSLYHVITDRHISDRRTGVPGPERDMIMDRFEKVALFVMIMAAKITPMMMVG